MTELKFGVLSTSSIAPRFIAAVRAAGVGRIVALSSRSLDKAEEKAKMWDVPVFYGDHQTLLADENINIVYISNVNSQHYPWAKAALEAGKHVICEKPCTTSEAETRALFALAREKNLFLMEAEKMLFLPALLEVKNRIEHGDLGEITMVEMSHSFPASYNGWMFDRDAGGGTLLSSGIYAIQLLLWFFGQIKTIRGTASKLDTGVEWQYILTGETENGVLFSAKNSTRAKLDNTCRIFGSKGYVEIPEYWKARKAVFHTENGTQEIHIPCEHELIYEVRHIAECFRRGWHTSPVVTEALSAAGIRALETVKKEW